MPLECSVLIFQDILALEVYITQKSAEFVIEAVGGGGHQTLSAVHCSLRGHMQISGRIAFYSVYVVHGKRFFLASG